MANEDELAAFRDPEVEALAEEAELERRELLLFELDGALFAVRALAVTGVVSWREPSAIPQASPRIAGVIQDSGRIIVVLRHPTAQVADGKSSASRVVVCGTKYGFIGLPATTTQGVQSVGLRAAPGSGDVVDTPAGATTYLEPAALVATLVDEGDESAPAGSTPPTPAARGGF